MTRFALHHMLPRAFIGVLTGLMALSAPGCGNDADTLVVDFSKRIKVEIPEPRKAEKSQLRVAVGAMISPKETFDYYRQILDYIGNHLGKEVVLIQRKTYAEVNDLFARGRIDIGFICSGPYAAGKEKYGFELLATPEVQGSHFYQAYLIGGKDSSYHSLADLRGSVFAFTDPSSNTGKLVPLYWLAGLGEQPESFFQSVVYTYSHDNSILAVSKGLVDAASVDGLIWEYYNQKNPAFTSKTRIIKKSRSYGIPPIVASNQLDRDSKQEIQALLLSMHRDPDGRRILQELMIDSFVEADDNWYDPIRGMQKNLALREN